MAVLQMQRMNLVAMKQNRKAILERLQEIGAMEIDIQAEKLKGTSCEDVATQRAAFEKWVSLADQAIEILDRYAPEDTSLLSMLDGRPLADRAAYEETVNRQEEYVEEATRIVDLEKQITEATSAIQKLENQAETLVPWEPLDVPMNTSGTKKATVFLGTMPEQVTEEQVLTALKTSEPAVDEAQVQIVSTGKDMTYLSVVCLTRDAAAAEEALRAQGFTRMNWVSHCTPREEQEEIRQEIAKKQDEIREHEAAIAEMAPVREHLKLVSDYYQMRADKYEVVGILPQTNSTFALSGYVPAKVAGTLAEELEHDYGAAVELLEIGPKEDAPVISETNKFSNCVDGIISSYGLPGKGDIDPTVIVSIFYVVLFGMMLSDAGYGLLIAIGCGFALLKFPRMEEGLRKSLKMFFFCGLSTIFWGILFGGFFGDAIQVISREFFGHEVVMKPIWFAPIDDPMRLLIFALFIGVIHLFLGLGISGFMLIRQKKFLAFFCDVVAWYLFLIGLLLMLLPSNIFESMSGMVITFGPAITYASYVLAIVGAAILLVMAGRRKKRKVGMRLLLGVYEIYGITSWLSDWLSYSRLLALGLATGAIAQVVNMIGTMFGSGVLKVIIFIVVFLIGHALNMAINVLGAYVHTNRLQYVEFFQKFYEGKGRPFHPFIAATKYVVFAQSK